jgi:predicted alpha/beta-hydrolase family hydrolase
MEEHVLIPTDKEPINAIINHSSDQKAVIALAHGAGAGMEHPFMKKLAHSLVEQSFTVLRFNFPYMSNGKKFPGNPKTNINTWGNVVNWANEQFDTPLFLSGKSYGGRMASHLLAENERLKVAGAIYFGFPLHAPGKPSTDRANHLQKVNYFQLFLQGTNDSLASFDLISTVCEQLPHVEVQAFEGADHSFKTKGINQDLQIRQLSLAVSRWIALRLQ